jgi:hypothetical protein
MAEEQADPAAARIWKHWERGWFAGNHLVKQHPDRFSNLIRFWVVEAASRSLTVRKVRRWFATAGPVCWMGAVAPLAMPRCADRRGGTGSDRPLPDRRIVIPAHSHARKSGVTAGCSAVSFASRLRSWIHSHYCGAVWRCSSYMRDVFRA